MCRNIRASAIQLQSSLKIVEHLEVDKDFAGLIEAAEDIISSIRDIATSSLSYLLLQAAEALVNIAGGKESGGSWKQDLSKDDAWETWMEKGQHLISGATGVELHNQYKQAEEVGVYVMRFVFPNTLHH